ncbi:type II and III secretion system protein family protein [Croceicoccus sp. BE223]|uniref:type II and III secretion system protein family protein n=1 Tax=Croceicoccus sp. BE223 TaxID=2817716 RepID=UPI002858C877|nr:type II and III secretion system protein family protein [Croceicoccus sp. BE223]MDR7101798.1 pilus assembly protein CpaC [Croceicoccus sp. BE223]
MKRMLASIAFAATALAPIGIAGLSGTAAAQSASLPKPTNEVVVSVGTSQLVNVGGRMADIFIADDKIADVQVKSANQVFVLGKSPGETTLYATDNVGRVIWSSVIRVGNNLSSIDQMLDLAMPEARIQTATMNNTVLLTGTVAAPEDAAEAERLVSAFVGPGTNVISRLRLATPLQVNLRVRFAEVSRSLVRVLGASVNTFDGTSGFKFGIAQGRDGYLPQWTVGGDGLFVGGTEAGGTGSLIKQNSGTSTIGGIGKFLGLDIAAALDVGETTGLVTTISEPNLTALSGETADFLAGGEYPIPVSSGLGSTSIEYKKFGVSLSYTPTVLANGRISIRVRPEVSELSSQGAVVVSGFQIPSLTVRRAETTIELGSGQSFMIAGLLQNGYNSAIEKTPGVADIPILGNLFRSNSFRKGETELVIVVTPYLVKPVDDADIVLPTDGLRTVPEFERLLLNKNTDGVTGTARPMPSATKDVVAPGISAATPQSADPARQPVRSADAAGSAPGFSF